MMLWQTFCNRLTRMRWQAALLLIGLIAATADAQPLHRVKAKIAAKTTGALTPAPHGSFVRRFQALQADKAEASDFVVFLDEWYQGGNKLGPYGQYHMTQIARRLPEVPFSVKVQPQANPALNEKRRMEVVEALLNQGIADADSRVVIAYPEAEGLRYEDIERVYTNSVLFPNVVGTPFGPNGIRSGQFGLGYGSGLYGFGFGRFGYGGGFGGWGGGFARPLIAGY